MSQIIEKSLPYTYGDKQHVGVLLRAADQQPTAAVVLLPDWRGQSGLARDHARYLMQHGCVVAIADLYGDGFSPNDPSQVGPMVKQLLDHRDEGVKALDACVKAMKLHLSPGMPVYCLGYSAGGMIALDYGRSGAKVAGIIVCSALLKTAAHGMSTRIFAPVLLLQGTQDAVSPMDVVNAVIKEMDEAGNDFRFELYSQTHHAFDNPEAGTDPTARLVYSPSSAARARLAIAEFLREPKEH
ncbi:dienelactone hydrolase family protein [Collimonas pratensis]|nr:dienelactone hydrolase family protein [Collimonas pratensis]